jgi:hypothetical protein
VLASDNVKGFRHAETRNPLHLLWESLNRHTRYADEVSSYAPCLLTPPIVKIKYKTVDCVVSLTYPRVDRTLMLQNGKFPNLGNRQF